jgi:hypothetical protein
MIALGTPAALSIESSAADRVTSKKSFTKYELKFRLPRIKCSEKKLNHSTYNSFPLRTFHHQSLESLNDLIESTGTAEGD